MSPSRAAPARDELVDRCRAAPVVAGDRPQQRRVARLADGPERARAPATVRGAHQVAARRPSRRSARQPRPPRGIAAAPRGSAPRCAAASSDATRCGCRARAPRRPGLRRRPGSRSAHLPMTRNVARAPWRSRTPSAPRCAAGSGRRRRSGRSSARPPGRGRSSRRRAARSGTGRGRCEPGGTHRRADRRARAAASSLRPSALRGAPGAARAERCGGRLERAILDRLEGDRVPRLLVAGKRVLELRDPLDEARRPISGVGVGAHKP